jgi:archaellum biogenesis protein FlaJ (TadC family)
MTKAAVRIYSKTHNFITVLAAAALLINITELISNLQQPLHAAALGSGEGLDLAPLFIWLLTALFSVIIAIVGIAATLSVASTRKIKKNTPSETYYTLFFLVVLISSALPKITL